VTNLRPNIVAPRTPQLCRLDKCSFMKTTHWHNFSEIYANTQVSYIFRLPHSYTCKLSNFCFLQRILVHYLVWIRWRGSILKSLTVLGLCNLLGTRLSHENNFKLQYCDPLPSTIRVLQPLFLCYIEMFSLSLC